MLEDRFAQHDKVIVDKFNDVHANYQMTTRDYVMRALANQFTGPITITLPPVAEVKGRWYSILARGADSVNTITIADKNDSECWVADIVLDGKCDRLLLYSDGLAWHPSGNVGQWPGVATTAAPGTTGVPETTATTAAPTTAAPTTEETTEAPSTTAVPVQTTAAPTTEAPTTVASTTVAPGQTTAAPTTEAPTTVASTTAAPTTVAPTTVASTTVAPTTL